MTKRNDGGPAYPQLETCGDMTLSMGGMSMRDYAAIHASDDDIRHHQEWGFHDGTNDCTPKYTREEARYRFADAMIAARDKA